MICKKSKNNKYILVYFEFSKGFSILYMFKGPCLELCNLKHKLSSAILQKTFFCNQRFLSMLAELLESMMCQPYFLWLANREKQVGWRYNHVNWAKYKFKKLGRPSKIRPANGPTENFVHMCVAYYDLK